MGSPPRVATLVRVVVGLKDIACLNVENRIFERYASLIFEDFVLHRAPHDRLHARKIVQRLPIVNTRYAVGANSDSQYPLLLSRGRIPLPHKACRYPHRSCGSELRFATGFVTQWRSATAPVRQSARLHCASSLPAPSRMPSGIFSSSSDDRRFRARSGPARAHLDS